MTETYVADVLRERLTGEVRSLGEEYLRIELDAPGGRLGQQRFKIILQGTPKNTVVRRVLSEGEFRCIALAGFFTEWLIYIEGVQCCAWSGAVPLA